MFWKNYENNRDNLVFWDRVKFYMFIYLKLKRK